MNCPSPLERPASNPGKKSEWKNLTRTAVIVLVILATVFFWAFAFDFGAWPLSWPLETASTLGLWLWSIALLLMRPPVRQEPE